jgi:hypothetical protein
MHLKRKIHRCIIHDNRMHVDHNQLQRKQDHFHRYKQNTIENYDQRLELLHDRKIVIYQNKYVHFEDESNQNESSHDVLTFFIAYCMCFQNDIIRNEIKCLSSGYIDVTVR